MAKLPRGFSKVGFSLAARQSAHDRQGAHRALIGNGKVGCRQHCGSDVAAGDLAQSAFFIINPAFATEPAVHNPVTLPATIELCCW